jgi:DNA-binding transcriptional MerR regulator
VLTISEVAAFAGLTVRAVRHYHQRGLLPEPPRDGSGYRRYDADALIALIRIRTLAEAGVPLARVAELLEADEAAFAVAVAELDVELRARQREIAQHRDRVRRLAGGDSLALPQVAVDYLEQLRATGVSEGSVKIERDSWVLINARYPEKVPEWMAGKSAQLARPAFADMYLTLDKARELDADDPQLEEVADRIVAVFRQLTDELAEEQAAGPVATAPEEADLEQPVVELLDTIFVEASPAWRRLVELVEQRGWVGWSDIREADE